MAGGNGAGSTADKLNGPWGVYVDNGNTVFVVDRNNHRVMKWLQGAAAGTLVAGDTGVAGSWSYQLNSPSSISMDPYGALFILDSGNARVQKWNQGGSFGVTVLGSAMSNPLGMQLDSGGNLFIADTNNHRILSFALMCRK